MLASGVVLHHDNARLHSAARTRALLEHFNWELFDHTPCSPDLALSNYPLFIYLKNCLGSQHFSNNEELMEGAKTWLSSQEADFFDTGIQNLFPNTTTISVLAVTMLRSSLSMYVSFIYNNIFFTRCLLC
jgi:hypothetical protein